MRDLKQLDPYLPRPFESPWQETKPFDADHAVKLMKPDTSSALNNEVSTGTDPVSSSARSASTIYYNGAQKASPETGAENKGPSKALPTGLIATRFSNHHESLAPRSSTSTTASSFHAECERMDFEANIPLLTSETSVEHDYSSIFHHCEDETGHCHQQHLHRELEDLREKLESSTARAEMAEAKADKMNQRIQDIKAKDGKFLSKVETNDDSLASNLSQLKTENSALREQLRDAQSHIFSLQPYRKELTPEEVGREYDDLFEGIADWVAKFMASFSQDYERGVENIMNSARKKPADALKLKQLIHQHPDLIFGSMYPETDEDIITAMIMRFLNDSIFQKILYGSCTSFVESFSFVETALQNHVEPKRDLFAIRTWTAEAYNAMLSSREFKDIRKSRMHELTVELAKLLKIFSRNHRWESFQKSCQEQCIKPAMQLYEKMQVSTHHFYFDMNIFAVSGEASQSPLSPDFFDSLPELDCKNVLQNRKAFSLARIDPPLSSQELRQNLVNICAVSPALYMRQIGQKDVIRQPQLVRRQQMLVAWGPVEKRESFLKEGNRTLLSHLSAKDELERSEGSGWTASRWAC